MTNSSECDKITFVLSEDKTYFTIISRRFSHGKRHDKGKSASGHSAVYGCYVHGIFDDREVADALIGALLEEKGYGEEAMHSMDYHAYKEKQYQILANAVRENMDMKKIYEIIEKGNAAECFI